MKALLTACAISSIYLIVGTMMFKYDETQRMIHGAIIPLLITFGTIFVIFVRRDHLPRTTTRERFIKLITYPNRQDYSLLMTTSAFHFAYRDEDGNVALENIDQRDSPVEFQYFTDRSYPGEIEVFVTTFANPNSWWILNNRVIFERKYRISIAQENIYVPN